jgi:hypothetical protein
MNLTTTKFALMQSLLMGAPLTVTNDGKQSQTLPPVTALELESGGPLRRCWNVTIHFPAGKKTLFMTTID